MFFSSEDLGTLYLNHEETKKYREVLNSIINDIDSEIISPKAIEKLFQQTILKSLNRNKKQNPIPLENRINDLLNDLEKSLNEAPRKIILYHPIEGLASEGLPFKFGKVEFSVFNNEDYSLFENTVKNNWEDGYSKQKLLETVHGIKSKEIDLYGKTIAKFEVSTIDYDAADILLRKALSLSMDVLNFYSDLIPYHDGFIFTPGEYQHIYIVIPMISVNKKVGLNFKYHRIGSQTNFSIAKLIEEDKKRNLGLAKISNLIAKNHNHLEDRIISAMRWAGSATAEEDKEKSFLEYIISLETLILGEKSRNGINYRLQTRVAKLFSKNYEEYEKIKNDIKRLYKIRSDIVHDGKYQVIDSDLALIRYYAKSSILRLLTDSDFDSIDNDDLLDWFNKKTFQ
ncbi:MAG: hypothetical protein GYA51_13760 [Candidatus Methanofastidiosa archaeon]|nr:hypothetical protein [Candidatus Methanofastidiosa archaeon]